MKHLKASVPVLCVFCLALFVRLVYNITIAAGYIPLFDAAIYNNLAHYLVVIHCYCVVPHHPAVFRPPLWPFILATMYFIMGEHSEYGRLFYCLLGSGTCVLIYLLAKDFFGKHIALITGGIAAIYTGLFIWDGWLYTESLYTFFLTAFILVLSRLQQSNPAGLSAQKRISAFFVPWQQRMVFGGIILGLALLTRPTGSILVGLLCIWAALVIVGKMMPWQTAVRSILVIVLVALAVNVPWLYRNYTITHTFVPVSAIGTVLVGAYNESVFRGENVIRGMWLLPSDTINPDFNNYTRADEKADTDRALHWMQTHPGETANLLGLHLFNMWTPYLYVHGLPSEEFPDRLASQVIVHMIRIMSIPVFLLAAFGLVVTWKSRKKQFLPVYLVIALTVMQNIVFYGSPRYRAPIEPLLVLLVGGALWWLTCDESGTFNSKRNEKLLREERNTHERSG